MSDFSWVHSGEVVALGWTLLHFLLAERGDRRFCTRWQTAVSFELERVSFAMRLR